MFRYQQSIHQCIALRSGYRLGTYTYFSDRSEFLPPYVYLLSEDNPVRYRSEPRVSCARFAGANYLVFVLFPMDVPQNHLYHIGIVSQSVIYAHTYDFAHREQS